MKNRSHSARSKKDQSLITFVTSLPYFGLAISALVTLFIGVALFSYNPHDPSWFYYSSESLPVTNYAGYIGAHCAAFCFYMWGTGAYIFIGIGMYVTYAIWREWSVTEELERAAALVSLLFTWPAVLALHDVGATAYMMAGGYLGQRIFMALIRVFDLPGGMLFLYVAVLAQLLLISRLSCIQALVLCKQGIVYLIERRRHWLTPLVRGIWYLVQLVQRVFSFFVHLLLQGVRLISEGMFGTYSKEKEKDPFEAPFWCEQQEVQEVRSQDVNRAQEVQLSVTGAAIPLSEKQVVPKKKSASYQLPATSLFAVPKKEESSSRDESKQVAAVLEEKLSRFGIAGSVVAIKKGPVVTLFEYEPAIDTKLSKIMALEQDLALALQAMSVRILAPIPGTARVGFEVSNKERKSVLFGESIRSQAFVQSKAALPFILGQDTAGAQVVVDLADMPHVLIAGSTGSGKSVALNTMLISLLCRLTPEQLKLIIIDPKRLEFASYHDIPHLLFPIITDPHRAAPVIRWLVRVMEDRYQSLAEQGVRSIHEYKKRCVEEGKQDELPFIVLIIDELADLMMVAGKESEEGIARLAQMARAAGIHLIVATQRPSVDVVTGVIKVNFPSRISFRLTSKIDSRTILDAAGAESLLGKGDMLFMDAHSARMRRVHGAYVSDAEIKKVADAVRTQQKVEYMDLQEAVALYQAQRQEIQDSLLPEVLQFLETIDHISISSLQRRFNIGYNRSARLMELLEGQGKVMPADGSKTRKVIH